jgi:2-polyprenyl-3-methyl-5-hydroxy-6-metoxy-1,4-benzoquinol methylase
VKERFLFLPSTGPGGGTGHLQRAIRLAGRIAGLRKTGLYVPASDEAAAAFAATRLPDGAELLRAEPEQGGWDFLVADRRETGEREWLRMLGWGGVPIGLDEGGPMRRRFPFLIDSLPVLPGTSPANRADTGFLEVPPRLRERPERIESVLVSFGGEDPAGLTGQCITALLEAGFTPASITAVKGPLFGECSFPEGVRVLNSPSGLSEHFAVNDLVCTSFGLTAFEAAAAGALVLLVHPGRYHRRLADAAGFVSAGTGRVDRRRFEAALADPEHLAEAAERAAPPEGGQPLESLLLSLRRPVPEVCPVCGRRSNRVLLREAERSFLCCEECAMVYQMDFGERGSRYTEHYFFEEYRRQYGRTYLEDAEHIRALSAPRARRLRRLLQGRGQSASGRLLDVGCAYGPFLQAAAAEGLRPEGAEISPEAAGYVREHLGYPVWTGAFEAYPPEQGAFDAVTMWYVIEHFTDLDAVLRKTGELLRPGGVFAFSTPNLKGGTGRFYPHRFLHGSPFDHFSLWCPRTARRVLRRYGFRVEQTVITGHHPERLPGGSASMGGFRRCLLRLLSTVAGLGDTFEIYARYLGE